MRICAPLARTVLIPIRIPSGPLNGPGPHPIKRTRQEPIANDQLIIFDTTLRDGEQPWASMTFGMKAGADRPPARAHEGRCDRGRFCRGVQWRLRAVRRGGRGDQGIDRICSLARANENDIRRAGEAIRPAAQSRIHTFIATSPIHMEKKLRMAPGPGGRAGGQGGSAGRVNTPTTWSSRPKTPVVPRSISWCRSSRKSSRPAPRPSTCRIPSATTSPNSLPRPSAP